jgi:hypothetical protein
MQQVMVHVGLMARRLAAWPSEIKPFHGAVFPERTDVTARTGKKGRPDGPPNRFGGDTLSVPQEARYFS